MIAFLFEMLKTWLEQWALIMQKLAHRHVEKSQSRNLVSEKEKNAEANATSDYSAAEKEQEVEEDVGQSVKTYCSWRFIVGFVAIILAMGIHICCLAYLDLTLISANSANCIIAA